MVSVLTVLGSFFWLLPGSWLSSGWLELKNKWLLCEFGIKWNVNSPLLSWWVINFLIVLYFRQSYLICSYICRTSSPNLNVAIQVCNGESSENGSIWRWACLYYWHLLESDVNEYLRSCFVMATQIFVSSLLLHWTDTNYICLPRCFSTPFVYLFHLFFPLTLEEKSYFYLLSREVSDLRIFVNS